MVLARIMKGDKVCGSGWLEKSDTDGSAEGELEYHGFLDVPKAPGNYTFDVQVLSTFAIEQADGNPLRSVSRTDKSDAVPFKLTR